MMNLTRGKFCQTEIVELEGHSDKVDFMLGCSWSHGRTPEIDIGIEESSGDTDTERMVDSCQFTIPLPDILMGMVNCMAYGLSGALSVAETKTVAFDAMITYLESMKGYFAENKALHLMMNAKEAE